VKVKAVFPGAIKRGENQRDDDDRENGMRAEQCEINRANHALSGEARYAVVRVIPKVAGEKDRGRPECREHADFVGQNAVGANEIIAERQQDGAGGVQCGIDGREVGELEAH